MNLSTNNSRKHYGRFTPFSDEQVIYIQHMHWRNRIGPAIIIFICTALLLPKVQYPHFSYIGFVWSKPLGTTLHNALYYATTLFLVYLILKAALTFIRSIFVRYYVTNQRVVATYGVLSIHTSEIMLSKCENIQLDQSVTERIFNSGDIQLLGAGSAVILNDVYRPRELKHFISELIHSVQKQELQFQDNNRETKILYIEK